MKSILFALIVVATLLLPACSASATVASPQTETQAPASTAMDAFTEIPEPSPTAALLPLEIVDWYEHSIANLVDPSSGVTNVEVLIHNPNDAHVRIDQQNTELRFLNSAGEVVYTNPNPFFYIWKGEWMNPGQTTALQACMCFVSEGAEKPEWETLELVAPLELIDPVYTTDVEFTAEFVLLEEVIHGYSGPGVATTLANTSDQVLESIATLVFAYDASGQYVGMASFGNAVASFTEDIGIQPGDTASGFAVSDINFLGNERLTYEVQAIGIIAQGVPTAEPLGAPATDWQGIPIMPGAVSGGEVSDGYEFTTQASVEEIVQFYEAAFADLGYSLTTSGSEAGITFLFFQSGSSQTIIGIFPGGGDVRVQISVTQ